MMDGHEIDCLNDINAKYATVEVQLEQKLVKMWVFNCIFFVKSLKKYFIVAVSKERNNF